jgi:hypothetical protein
MGRQLGLTAIQSDHPPLMVKLSISRFVLNDLTVIAARAAQSQIPPWRLVVEGERDIIRVGVRSMSSTASAYVGKEGSGSTHAHALSAHEILTLVEEKLVEIEQGSGDVAPKLDIKADVQVVCVSTQLVLCPEFTLCDVYTI